MSDRGRESVSDRGRERRKERGREGEVGRYMYDYNYGKGL